jgi:arylsulfatase A-like enzyme
MKFPLFLSTALLFTATLSAATETRPNIVFILCDDLGYGDVHCLNPGGCKIPTPNLDKLASEGMTLTDEHSSASVCTPSRYSILTGRYNWRCKLQHGVLHDYGSALIPQERLTVAGMLRQQGYYTAAMGKWHLGWEWPKKGNSVDFTKPIEKGPTAVGFDYYFGAEGQGAPYCFIENDHTVGIPSVPLPKKLTGGDLPADSETDPNGSNRETASQNKPLDCRTASVPGWKSEDMLPVTTKKACDFIANRSKLKTPFFLYLALPSPHTPLVPTKEWQGKSGLGDYGDYVMETDWAIGQVINALDKSGAGTNTIVLVSSDNGVAPYVGVGSEQLTQLQSKGFDPKREEKAGMQHYKELEAMGHFSSGGFRGHKSDIWDGGHRVPTFVRWPGKVQPGSSSDQLVSLVDFMATCADILQVKLPPNAAEDSVSILPVLLGKTTQPVHEAVVFHSIFGMFAIQQGNWKLELCSGSGGWGSPRSSKDAPPVQLYDMSKDVGERSNEEAQHPDIVARLTKLLDQYVSDGRSTPGPRQTNDVPINLWKERSDPGENRKK